MSNLHLNELKSAIKKETEATLNFLLNLTGNSNNETNSLQKLLLINPQISKIRKAFFANRLSANKKCTKIQLSKIVESVGFTSLHYLFIAVI